MGFLTRLHGWTEFAKFRCVVSVNGDIIVHVLPTVDVFQTLESVQLWACYQSKMIHVFGGANTPEARRAREWMRQLGTAGVSSSTDVFASLGLSAFVRYGGSSAESSGHTYSGTYHAKDGGWRMVQTALPLAANPAHAMYTSLAMMQHTLVVAKGDEHVPRLLAGTAGALSAFYDQGHGNDAKSMAQIPVLAFHAAMAGLAAPPEVGRARLHDACVTMCQGFSEVARTSVIAEGGQSALASRSEYIEALSVSVSCLLVQSIMLVEPLSEEWHQALVDSVYAAIEQMEPGLKVKVAQASEAYKDEVTGWLEGRKEAGEAWAAKYTQRAELGYPDVVHILYARMALSEKMRLGRELIKKLFFSDEAIIVKLGDE